jgi:hypothetical protein
MPHEKQKKHDKVLSDKEQQARLQENFKRIKNLTDTFEGALNNIPTYRAEPLVPFCDIYAQNEFIGKEVQFTRGKYEWEISTSSIVASDVEENKSIYINRRHTDANKRPVQDQNWISAWDEHAIFEYSRFTNTKYPLSAHLEYTPSWESHSIFDFDTAIKPLTHMLKKLQKPV